MNRRNVVFTLVTVVGVVLDQATKAWVVSHIAERVGRVIVIPGFFDLVHEKNPGAALGLLRDFEYRYYVFFAFTVLAGLVVFDLFRRLPPSSTFLSTSLGLILSGAVGNAIDRLFHAEVTDFIRIYIGNDTLRHLVESIPLVGASVYPTFNIADAALVVGVGMLFVHYLLWERSSAAPSQAQPGEGGP